LIGAPVGAKAVTREPAADPVPMEPTGGLIKDVISRLGALLPEAALHYANAVLNYLEVGNWMRRHGHRVPSRLQTRTELFDLIARRVADRPVLYLEFGVAAGDSMRYWARALRHPQAHLHGFDSFEGLPSRWTWRRPKGYFSTGGVPPEIPDPRVRFFKGWFEQTLLDYRPPDHASLVVNMDADLYSSTAFVLGHITDLLRPGALIYFDEFNHRADELRAFDEFIERTGMRFQLIGATRGLAGVAFQRDV
jgi:hypothetical protein